MPITLLPPLIIPRFLCPLYFLYYSCHRERQGECDLRVRMAYCVPYPCERQRTFDR